MAQIPGRLYFVTMDEAPVGHIEQVEAACRAGITWIQLRMKEADTELFLETARAAQKICKAMGSKLIINDRVDIAAAVGADGVHLGLQDMPLAEARRLLGDGVLIGGTANTLGDIREHVRQGADYIGLGPYRYTRTKKNLSPILGLEGYRRIMMQLWAEDIRIPVVAIGGIGQEDAATLRDTGVAAIAFSGMWVYAKDGMEMVRMLKEAMGVGHGAGGVTGRGLTIADKTFDSRLFTGTGKFGSSGQMEDAILASGSELVTVALKRVDTGRAAGSANGGRENGEDLLLHLRHPHIHLLPNTSGVRTAKEAVFAAELAREALGTNWLKLEIHPDPRWLLPDPVETLVAAEELVKKGFVVLPYIHADPVLCRRLEDVGVAAVMPLGAPIGSNKGLRTVDFLEIIIAQSRVPVVVDAGIGAPSDAARALEMGADAVLVNTAIASSADPVVMARAFRLAVESGRMAFGARLAVASGQAVATSPLTAFLDQV